MESLGGSCGDSMGQLWGRYGAGLTHTCAPQHDFVVGERPQGTMAALIRRALGADDDDDDDVGGAAPQVVSYGAALPHKWGVMGRLCPTSGDLWGVQPHKW